jgi:VanZ family protein
MTTTMKFQLVAIAFMTLYIIIAVAADSTCEASGTAEILPLPKFKGQYFLNYGIRKTEVLSEVRPTGLYLAASQTLIGTYCDMGEYLFTRRDFKRTGSGVFSFSFKMNAYVTKISAKECVRTDANEASFIEGIGVGNVSTCVTTLSGRKYIYILDRKSGSTPEHIRVAGRAVNLKEISSFEGQVAEEAPSKVNVIFNTLVINGVKFTPRSMSFSFNESGLGYSEDHVVTDNVTHSIVAPKAANEIMYTTFPYETADRPLFKRFNNAAYQSLVAPVGKVTWDGVAPTGAATHFIEITDQMDCLGKGPAIYTGIASFSWTCGILVRATEQNEIFIANKARITASVEKWEIQGEIYDPIRTVNVSFTLDRNYSVAIKMFQMPEFTIAKAILPASVQLPVTYDLLTARYGGQFIDLVIEYYCPCIDPVVEFCGNIFRLSGNEGLTNFKAECLEYWSYSRLVCCGEEIGRKLHLFPNLEYFKQVEKNIDYLAKPIADKLVDLLGSSYKYLALAVLAVFLAKSFGGKYAVLIFVVVFIWTRLGVEAEMTTFTRGGKDSNCLPIIGCLTSSENVAVEETPRSIDSTSAQLTPELKVCDARECKTSFTWTDTIFNGYKKEIDILNDRVSPRKLTIRVLDINQQIQSEVLYDTGVVNPVCTTLVYCTHSGWDCRRKEESGHLPTNDINNLYHWKKDRNGHFTVPHHSKGWCPSFFKQQAGETQLGYHGQKQCPDTKHLTYSEDNNKAYGCTFCQFKLSNVLTVRQVSSMFYMVKVKFTMDENENQSVIYNVEIPNSAARFDLGSGEVSIQLNYVPPRTSFAPQSLFAYRDRNIYTGGFAEKFRDGYVGWFQRYKNVSDDQQCNVYSSRDGFVRVGAYTKGKPAVSITSGLAALSDPSLFTRHTGFVHSRSDGVYTVKKRLVNVKINAIYQFTGISLKIKQVPTAVSSCVMVQNFTTYKTVERQRWVVTCTYSGDPPVFQMTGSCGFLSRQHICVGVPKCRFRAFSHVVDPSGTCRMTLTLSDGKVKEISAQYEAEDGSAVIDITDEGANDAELEINTFWSGRHGPGSGTTPLDEFRHNWNSFWNDIKAKFAISSTSWTRILILCILGLLTFVVVLTVLTGLLKKITLQSEFYIYRANPGERKKSKDNKNWLLETTKDILGGAWFLPSGRSLLAKKPRSRAQIQVLSRAERTLLSAKNADKRRDKDIRKVRAITEELKTATGDAKQQLKEKRATLTKRIDKALGGSANTNQRGMQQPQQRPKATAGMKPTSSGARPQPRASGSKQPGGPTPRTGPKPPPLPPRPQKPTVPPRTPRSRGNT